MRAEEGEPLMLMNPDLASYIHSHFLEAIKSIPRFEFHVIRIELR